MALEWEDKKFFVRLAMLTVVAFARVMGVKCSMRSIRADFRTMFVSGE